MIYWLTGQPGSGKTTLGNWLIAALGGEAVLVDGDDIREIFENKDYSEQGRRKNIEKVALVCCLVSAKYSH